ncbi:hypothetical protein C5C31_11130 [Rathayibacter rathayi]|uniref:hypothetical protein n=1 Tax=Rathayibacter rathayi TaxID=33887 RepID=UPI000CE828C1|nr:hypothetical protein [Rathayibacter rathayi]PPG68406.1 hypothetical protein C5C02_07990 [Rathayibacter rathayi]PPG74974.1 hypothetical protein C5C23_11430 [Rathayibacter rathayi]PPH20645.1 hypothetical protein C5C31_11130 [Rathayibacter rathayi]PPI76084.1 hypothetical protein C5E03_11645 [Rathayibacter rathayi]
MAARLRHRGPGSGTDSDSAPRSSCTDFWLTRGLLLATFLVTTWATFSTLMTLSPAAGLSRPTPLISPYVLALSIPFGFFAAIAVSRDRGLGGSARSRADRVVGRRRLCRGDVRLDFLPRA